MVKNWDGPMEDIQDPSEKTENQRIWSHSRGPRLARVPPIANRVLLGRAADVDLFTDDEGVSRRHAQIVLEGKIIGSKTGSTNGILVNGER